MNSPNYYHGINNPSTSYGYYGHSSQYHNQQHLHQHPQQQTVYPSNYYVDDSSDEGSNPRTYQQLVSGQQHNYYEPIFHPPSSLYYTHNYTRHSTESNSQCNPPPVQSLSGQSSWYQQPMGSGSQQEQMLSMVQYSNSNGREARNRAEKNRRDKLNGSIQELSSMVPHVAESPRRVDKTAVLRFSAHGLRLQYIFGKTLSRPPSVKPLVTDSLMRLLDSFLITVTCRGQIVLISPSVEQHLGHCQTDLFGQNILHITHPDDHSMLKKQLIPTDIEKLFDIQPEDDGEQRPRTEDEEEEIDRKLRADKRVFSVRFARAGPRAEPTTYELVKIDGCFRRADSAPRGVKASTFPSGLQLIRRARGRDDSIPLHTISGNDIVLVALARVIKPPSCERLKEPNHCEYQTRHLIDGRIIECDQRISLVAGYMTEEVIDLSPFTFMHQDDVRWVIVALRQMYDCNSEYGESCYRLLTGNGEFIYLRTRGYMEIDKQNVVRTFLCINTLLSEAEGRRLCQEMKRKLTIIVKTTIPSTPAIDAPAAENPLQLERAIIYLIQNLQSLDEDDDETESKASYNGSESDSNRHTKSPPLALIPPKQDTIKTSIIRSVDVVNITIARSLRSQQQRSPARIEELKSPIARIEEIPNQARPSVLQKSGSFNEPNGFKNKEDKNLKSSDDIGGLGDRVPPLPSSKGYFDFETPGASISELSEEHTTNSSPIKESYPRVIHQSTVLKRVRVSDFYEEDAGIVRKKRTMEIDKDPLLIEDISESSTDLNQVLVNSFEELGQSLTQIGNATSELQDQQSAYPVNVNSQQHLEELIEEQQEQKEILENIRNEYQAHIQQMVDPDIPSAMEDESSNHTVLKPR